MRVAISIAEHEREMALKWLDWVSELGGTENHALHIIPAAGMDMKEIYAKADKAFSGSGVTTQIDYEAQTSDWQNKEQLRSASGPNSAFRQVAWHIYQNKTGPWFWCELDCIPLRKDWLDRLEAEYKTCGKKFMGAHVEIEGVPPHLTGNSIYPQNVPEEAPTLVRRTNWTPKGQTQAFELAFDIAGAREVLQKAHFTNLIQHIFRHKGFGSRAEFDATIDPNAVVFHSCKDGSIFTYLRENLSGGISETKRQCVGVKTLAESQTDSQFEPEGASSIRDVPSAQTIKGLHTQTFAEIDGNLVDITNREPTVASRTSTHGDDIQNVIKQNSVIKNGLPAMSPPWENREDSERDVKMLCDALALFAKAPIYKSRVRNALREAKIIK